MNETQSIVHNGRPTTVVISGVYHYFKYYYYVFVYDNQLNLKAAFKDRDKKVAVEKALDDLSWNLKFLKEWDLVQKVKVPICDNEKVEKIEEKLFE